LGNDGTSEVVQCEYELIVGENDEIVVFQIGGRDVTISRAILVDYDDEGRCWLAREDAEKMGLLP